MPYMHAGDAAMQGSCFMLHTWAQAPAPYMQAKTRLAGCMMFMWAGIRGKTFQRACKARVVVR